MLYILIGIIIGVLLGWAVPYRIPVELAPYSGVVILALVDTAIQAVVTQLEGRYSLVRSVFNLVFYVVIAVFLVYMGTRMNIDLYLGIIIVFLLRIVQNVEVLREYYFQKLFDKKK